MVLIFGPNSHPLICVYVKTKYIDFVFTKCYKMLQKYHRKFQTDVENLQFAAGTLQLFYMLDSCQSFPIYSCYL